MKLVFFGSGDYVIPVIEALKKDFEPFIITTEKEKQNPLIKYSIENKIPYVSISAFDENIKLIISNLKSDVAVLANFRLIIPKQILNTFKFGVLNIHPSLLPKYRGATPGQTAILNEDKTTGVSIIKLDEEMDHGPVLAQKEEEILANDTSESLYLRLFKVGAELLKDTIHNYLNNEVKLIEQNHKLATYSNKLSKEDGYIDYKNPPDNLRRIIKAYYPWPGVWIKTNLKNKNTRIKLLPNNKIQVEGKKPMSYRDFLNGYNEGKIILEKLQLF